MTPTEINGLIINCVLKGLLIIMAIHFWGTGSLFLAGLCLGWIIFEAIAFISLKLWG
jgi:hypothetical protein